jgi:hypothetical protein
VTNVIEECNRKEVDWMGGGGMWQQTEEQEMRTEFCLKNMKKRSNLGDRKKGRSWVRNSDKGYFI